MAEIANNTRREVILPTKHVIPAHGKLTVDQSVMDSTDNARFLTTLAGLGEVNCTNDPEPEPKPEPSTKTKASKAAKPETEA